MALPAPITWTDGEEPENIPTADDLNTDWRDSFNFLLGYTRPMIYVSSTSAQAITTTPVAITWNTEVLIRGGMVHSTSTNSHQITVPYTGYYTGYAMPGFASMSTATMKGIARILNGSTTVAIMNSAPPTTSSLEFVMPFTTYATAGDIFTFTMAVSTGTATANSTALTKPRMAMWFAGDG